MVAVEWEVAAELRWMSKAALLQTNKPKRWETRAHSDVEL
jgi:hypothetical protein